MSDKIEKIVDININIDGDGNLEKVNQGLDNLSKKTEGAVSANNKLKTSNDATKKSVLENGGAMGLLSAATGGLAMDFKDAVEAIELTGVSLKGLRGAIIATGVGALAILVLELVTNWDKWVGVIDGSTAAMEKLNREIKINNARREKSNLITSKEINNAEQEIRLLEARGASAADLEKAYTKLDAARQKQARTDLSTAKSNIAKLDAQLRKTEEYIEINDLLNSNLRIQASLQKGIVSDEARRRGVFNIEEANKLVDGAQKRLDYFKSTNEIGKQLLEQEKAKVAAQIALNNATTDPKVRQAQKETANREKQIRKKPRKKKREAQEKADLEDLRQFRLTVLKAEEDDLVESLKQREDSLKRLEGIQSPDPFGDITAQQTALMQVWDNEQLSYEARLASLDAFNEQVINAVDLTEQEKTDILNANSEARKRIELAELEQKNEIQNAYADLAQGGSNLLKQIGEKNKGIQKAAIIAENAVAVARIIQNTQVANLKAVATSPTTKGQPWVGINTAFAGLSIGSTVLATNKALKELGGGSAEGAKVGGGDSGAPQAQFDLVQTSSTNQLASRIGQSQNQPVQAFVVGNQVTTQQELDRNRITTATFL